MNLEKLKSLIKEYEGDGILRNYEFKISLFNIIMEDELRKVKSGQVVGGGLPCCCSNAHKQDEWMELDLSIHPHGYSIKQKGSLWQRLKIAINPKTKWITIIGGC